jgi:putative transposase
MRLVTLMHTQRWHAHRSSTGTGHLYQGRFKSFAVQHDSHFLTVCRYVEANALRGGLVRRAEDWRWCSLWRVCNQHSDKQPSLDDWPVTRPSDWVAQVNEATPATEIDALRTCTRRGAPYGCAPWRQQIVKALKIEGTLRPRGRPKKGSDPFSRSGSDEKGV